MNTQISSQTLRRLSFFATIAAEGSIRGAAHRLRLSAPVVSTALSELEEELGTTLITRTTRRHELTAAGREVLTHATEMLAAANRAVDVTRGNTPLSGTVTLTLPSELTTRWLPPKLQSFREAHPGVALSVQPEDAIVTLKAAPADIALRTRLVDLDTPIPSDTVLAFPLDCVCADPPRLSKITSHMSLDMPLIGSPGHATWLTARHRKRTIRLDFPSGLSAGSKAAALAMAREGLGAALLLSSTVEEDIASGRLHRLSPDLNFGWIEGRIVFRDKLPSREARAFARHLTSET